MLLARDGHDVTVLEGDHEPPPSEAPRAWGVWKRRGVPQFRQPHNLFPRFQHILDAELPEVTELLLCQRSGATRQLCSGRGESGVVEERSVDDVGEPALEHA